MILGYFCPIGCVQQPHPFIRSTQVTLLPKIKPLALWSLKYIQQSILQPTLNITSILNRQHLLYSFNMAESAPAFKTQMVQKSVQELVLNGDELPENYIRKDRDGGDLDVPLVEIPVVNLGLLKSLSTSKEELQKLRSALSTWGCIQVLIPTLNITSVLSNSRHHIDMWRS